MLFLTVMEYKLTKRQSDILKYIISFRKIHDSLPSRKHLQRHYGWASPNASANIIKVLVKKKKLVWDDESPVGYRLNRTVKDKLIKRALNDYARKQNNPD